MSLSVTRSSASRRLVSALLAATCIITVASPVYAANNNINPNGSSSSGGTGGFAKAHGHHDLSAGLGSGTVADANNDGKHSAASADTLGVAGARQGHHHEGSFVHLRTGAGASAYADRKTLHAHAYAWTAGVAGASGEQGKVIAKTENSSEAEALRIGNVATAWAESSAGGFAAAFTNGHNYSTSAVVPDGNSRTFERGHMDFAIAWNSDGAFSFAESGKGSAFAETGTVSDTGAFASGHLGAILKGSTFAAAFVGGNTAWASAEASIFGFSGNHDGNSSAGLWSSAEATASYSPPPQANTSANMCEYAHDWKKWPLKPDLKKRWYDECATWRFVHQPKPLVGHS